MSNPAFQVPEPRGPEHQLIVDVGDLPTLSPGLRNRVQAECLQQVRLGRNAARMRVIAAVVAASLLISLVWHFRGTGRDDMARSGSPADLQPAGTADGTKYQSPGQELTGPGAAPQVPQGGPPAKSREDIREMQQINQMIEQLNQRQNILCGAFPVWK